MIQNNAHCCTIKSYALDSALPQYATVSLSEVDAIFRYVDEGRYIRKILKDKSEHWIINAYQELRLAERLTDIWLSMEIGQLCEQQIEHLDDFSLATYAAVLQHRDEEKGSVQSKQTSILDKVSLVFECIADNRIGSNLLYYGWLFSDMVAYDLARDEPHHMRLLHVALAFELRWGTSKNVVYALARLACERIRRGELERGAHMITRIVEQGFAGFRTFETAAVAFHNAHQKDAVKVILEGAQKKASDDKSLLDAYDDLCWILPRQCSESSSPHPWVRTMQQAVMGTISSTNGMSLANLVAELVPGIYDFPVKEFPGR